MPKAGGIVLVAVIDNLVKGAAGSGGAEPQRAARPRRADGPAVKKRLVLKLGGELLEQPHDLERVAKAIARLASRAALVVVHGGGKEIDAALATAGIPKQQVDGLRVTDARNARRRRLGPRRRDQHTTGRGGAAGGRQAGRTDWSRRDGRDGEACRADRERGRRVR